MHFFTSININYFSKARVLAKSVKTHCKDSWFTLVLSDKLPDGFDLSAEPFDEVWLITDLGLPVENLDLWIFTHSVIELCTAVKGQALLKALNSDRSDKIVYLDPDIAVFDNLSMLDELMNEHDIIITPHITKPIENRKFILAIEIQSMLAHGIYNLGFIAVKKSDKGLKFATWWRDRLMDYCVDDVAHGLFTDQKWIDLAPVLFDAYVLKHTAFNAAAWNIMQRKVTLSGGRYYVDSYPLQFYHFTGFNSGAHEVCMNTYDPGNKSLLTLLKWYSSAQENEGENLYSKSVSIYNVYSNNVTVSPSQRYLIRSSEDLLEKYKDCNPYKVTGNDKCYYTWYQKEFIINGKTDILHPGYKEKRIKELEKQVSSGKELLGVYIKLIINSRIKDQEKRKRIIGFFTRLKRKLKLD